MTQSGFSTSKNHFVVLDSWRGIAALTIAVFHFRINSHIADYAFWSNAGLFVDFFFVLSGFVIFYNYAERLQEGFGFWRFMFLRFGRLYPLHFFILWVHIGWEILQIFVPFLSGFAKFEPFGQEGESLDFILSNFFLLHALGFYDYSTVPLNGASWSISAEFYTYALFALILLMPRVMTKYFVVLVCLAAGLFLFWNGAYLYSTLEFGFIRCIYGFGVGGILWTLYAYLQREKKLTIPSSIIVSALEIGLCAGIIVLLNILKGPYSMLAVPYFAAMIYVFSFEAGVISRILQRKAFLWLGVLSYSVYMTHSFIGGKLASAVQLADKFLPWRFLADKDGEDVLGADLWQGDMITAFYVIIVLGISFITYKLIEEPGRNLSRKIIKGNVKIKFTERLKF